ncbi:putative receptor-like protein kinase [Raphanus sativus]|uniref:Probable receptor-like protein kinase At2g23200 n=1 Tax=Raphanus sativus TaxID=3726 RepID=A0A6J0LKE3_RAPSA|nr:probable receptor-like protein kinase At2g23200 [Raphanus sativus]KAJ4873962.1 putative receptor-like protein kinase [Raphanus sativus]
MENLCFGNSVSLFMKMAVIVLLSRHTLSATSPYYVNCGSDSNVIYGNRTFVGDMISDGNSVSFNGKGSEASNQSGYGIYGTVRIFRHPSSYKFQLDSVGLHFVRLHFSAASSQTARFTVSATSGSTHHFKGFSVQNFNETPRVEEFLLMINSPKLEIRFAPERSSVALINAIEVFSARNDLENTPEYGKNLHTIYRLNVGGKKITPENDTLGRTWSLDDDFLYRKDSAKAISSTQTPNYNPGSASATSDTAPDFVYQTGRTMNRSINEGVAGGVLMNVTWSFKVRSNSRHFIRAHFCDIKDKSLDPDSDFHLYVTGHSRRDVKPSIYVRLMTPFYFDFNVSDGFELLNVSISAKDPTKDAGFLNGLEVMEFLKTSSNESSSRVYIVAGCVAGGSILVLSLLFVVCFIRMRSKKKKKDTEVTVWSPLALHRGGSSDNRPFDPVYSSPLRTNTPFDPVYNSPLRNLRLGLKIPFTDIVRATNNFEERWLIGKGGFGDVYKAILPDGSRAAIKRAKTGSGQGILEFQTEIQVLSRIRHKHLVALKGYCEENSEMILVYEFMEKGTLKEHLYGSDLAPLSWKQRLEICIGAAKGLQYLHSGSEGIIHRDIKSTNILLDENNVAKVADFGLSKLVVRNQDSINISTNIKGTFGYLDPEYLETHVLTEKSDVYAFGVVLLEALCARPALDRYLPHEQVNLAEWAMFCKSKGTLDEVLDPKLVGQIEPSSLRKFMEIVDKCLKEYGEERPGMADVIWDLEYALQLHMTPIQREPHEDSSVTISDGGGGSSLVVPRLMVSDSFSSNSFVQKKSSYGGTDSSETQVFSQLNISEAR